MEPEKTAPALAHAVHVGPLPPRGRRRATAAVRRWWRRLWRIDLDHLTDGWTELGYVEDDGLASITETPEVRITFHESDVSPDLWALLFGRAPKHRNDTWPVDWPPRSLRRYAPERPRPAHRAPKHRAEGDWHSPSEEALAAWARGRTFRKPLHRKDDR